MKTTIWTLKTLAVCLGLFALTACNVVSRNAESSSMLIIESITGTLADGTTSNYLQSSVTSGTSDNATVTLQAALIDPSSPTGSSQYNSVTLTSYTIDYFLPDGSGAPGTTVPNSIQGLISSTTIPVGSSASVTLMAVLASAKLAAPLAALAGTTTQLTILAKITVQGQDLSNKTVTAKGQLSIVFGDFPVSTGS